MLAYFDCFSGISGDMTLGAFIDLGVSADTLQRDLAGLPIESFSLNVSHVEHHGIRAVRCEVNSTESAAARHLKDIEALIQAGGLPASVKDAALAVFRKMASAEAAVHGCSVNEVHFHEVGAVDAIVDIVGCALCMEYLGVTRVAVSALPQGRGFVACRHGRLPLPAPATMALLKGLPVYGADLEGELVTPTGAAIVSALGKDFGPMPAMTVSSVGYGAGKRRYRAHPNLLRIAIGEPCAGGHVEDQGYLTDTVHTLETTIDDMNPEYFGYLMELLFENGALDVVWIPAYMKKNRPGTLVQVFCHEAHTPALRDILFRETTTLGLRVSKSQRWMLPRESVTLSLSMGRIVLKKAMLPDGEVRFIPEYEACRRLARKKGIPLRRAYEEIAREAAAGGN